MLPRSSRSTWLLLGALVASLACLVVLRGRVAEAAAAPTITSVSPSLGPSVGGTAVTITGTGFVSGATVTIGGVAATAVTVVSSTQITATTPAGAPGSAIVTVMNLDTQAATLSGGFTFQYPAPTTSSVLPVSGNSAGGTAITITGTGFRAGATVTVGGTAATAVVVVDATTITASTPAHPVGAASVLVTNTDSQSGTLTDGYTYNASAAPTVTDVAPTSGSIAGGTAVTVTGTGFVTGATVKFGGTAATAVTVTNATTITATTPAGAATGAVTIVVSNPDTQSGALSGAYTYNALPAPTVSSVSPTTGVAAGGTSITITGTGFVSGATVKVGGVSASSVVVASATSITAVTPQRAAGAVSVAVTNPDSQSGTLAGGFTATANAAPVATAVTPSTGSTAGGTPISITGTGFLAGATVLIGGTTASPVTVVSSTLITATTSAHVVGQAPVTVVNYDGQTGTNTTGFTYKAGAVPTITSVAPATGPVAGGTSVTITGTNFQTGATVRFGASMAASVTVAGTTGILVITPWNVAGAAPVVVTNPDGQVALLATGFTYAAAATPVITEVSPSGGPFLGGTVVTITGTGFAPGATVMFGPFAGYSASVTDSTSIVVTTPLNVLGAVPVTVTNPDGQAGILPDGFRYLGPPPTVTGIDPSSGTLAGGTVVTITGSGFVSGATVTFGGTAATNVSVVSGYQLTATTPLNAAAGAVDVAVSNPGTAPATLTGGFTYQAAGAANVAATPPVGGIVFMVSGTNDLQALIKAQKFTVAAVFTFDVVKQAWKIYVVGAPANTLAAVTSGDIVVLRR